MAYFLLLLLHLLQMLRCFSDALLRNTVVLSSHLHICDQNMFSVSYIQYILYINEVVYSNRLSALCKCVRCCHNMFKTRVASRVTGCLTSYIA